MNPEWAIKHVENAVFTDAEKITWLDACNLLQKIAKDIHGFNISNFRTEEELNSLKKSTICDFSDERVCCRGIKVSFGPGEENNLECITIPLDIQCKLNACSPWLNSCFIQSNTNWKTHKFARDCAALVGYLYPKKFEVELDLYHVDHPKIRKVSLEYYDIQKLKDACAIPQEYLDKLQILKNNLIANT